jgi:hypothetical protein
MAEEVNTSQIFGTLCIAGHDEVQCNGCKSLGSAVNGEKLENPNSIWSQTVNVNNTSWDMIYDVT